MNGIFYNDEILDCFENNGEWEKSIRYIQSLLNIHSDIRAIFFRYAAQSWYVLTNWDSEILNDNLDRNYFQTALSEACLIAREKWSMDSDCMWLFGYFMCINPVDFEAVSANVFEVDRIGEMLIEKSYFQNQNNRLAEIMHLMNKRNKRSYARAVKKIEKDLHLFFPSNSSVDRYFLEIFSRHHLY